MSKTTQVMLFVPTLLVVAAFTAITDRAPGASATCEIRMTPTPVGMKIDGVVHGRVGQSDTYQLELLSSGANGNSEVSQGGDFVIPASGEAVVSESELGFSRGDAYRVSMSLSSGARCEQHPFSK